MEFGYSRRYDAWQNEYDTIEEALDALNETFDTLNNPLDRYLDLGGYEGRVDAINNQRPLFEDILASDELAPQGLTLLERMLTETPSRFEVRDVENLQHRGCQIISINDERIMKLAASEDAEVSGRALRLLYAAGEKFYHDRQGPFMVENLKQLAWNASLNPYHELHNPKYATESLISCVISEDKAAASSAIEAAHEAMYTPETTGFGTAVYEGLIQYAFNNDKTFGARQETIDLYKTRPELLDYKLRLGDYLRHLGFRSTQAADALEVMSEVDTFYAQAKTDPAMLEAFQRSLGVYLASPQYSMKQPVLYSSWMRANGLGYGTYIRAWEDGCGDKMRPQDYEERNIEAMAAIELIEPGAVKTLTQTFGIHNFMRYPTRTLINQYRNRDNKDLEYGVYIMPYTDHNGAFHASNGQSHLIDSFERSLEQVDAGMRIYEVDRIGGAARAIFSARYKYEKQLHFAVIGGHGTPNTLQFDSSDILEGYMRRMQLRRIPEKSTDRMIDIFTRDATIILDSCNTGQVDGLAEEINAFLSVESYAPTVPSKLTSIDVLSGDQPNDFTLIPRYVDQGRMAHFPRPQRIK